MLIGKMNRFIDKHGRAALIIIALAFMIPLLYSWAPGTRMGGGGGARGSRHVGRMYGRRISRAELFRNVYAVQLPYYMATGRWMHEDGQSMEMLTEAALNRMRMVREGKRMGVDRVGQAEIDERLRMMFTPQGQPFSAEFYEIFVARILPQLGLSERDFTDIVRESIIVENVQNRMAETVVVDDAEVEEAIRRQHATYAARQSLFTVADYLEAVELIGDEQVSEYFGEHRGTLRLPDMRAFDYVVFTPEDYAGQVVVDDHEVEQYFTQRKAIYDRQEKGLAEARDEIVKNLVRQKSHEKARAAARDFATALAAVEMSEKSAAAVFATVCETFAVSPQKTGPFSKFSGDTLPGLVAERSPRFKEAALALSENAPFSAPIYEAGLWYVVRLAEIFPGEEATELTEALAQSIRRELETAKARHYYNRRIEPFRPALEGLAEADELKEKFRDDRGRDLLPAEYAEMDPGEFAKLVDEMLTPFFIKTRKQAKVVVFAAADFADLVVAPGDAEIQAAYDAAADEYAEKIEASHILLQTTPETSAEERQELKAQVAGIRQRLEAGEAFDRLAREHSDCPSAERGGALGRFSRGSMVEPFEDAAFALGKGEISDLVETRFGYHIIKVTDREAAKMLAEVRDELVAKLKAERALERARSAADDFAYEAFDRVGNASVPPAEAFTTFAEARGLSVESTNWFEKRGFTPPFIGDWQAVQEAFKVSEDDPVSPIIVGGNKIYVVCWAGTQAGALPEFKTEDAFVDRVLGMLRREEALRLARQAAVDAHATLASRLADEMAFDEASEGYEFTETADFSLSEPPSGEHGGLIAEMASETPAGTLSAPMDIAQGALLVFVEEVKPVPDEELEARRAATRARLLNEKRNRVLETFLQELKDASNTEMDEEFRYSS